MAIYDREFHEHTEIGNIGTREFSFHVVISHIELGPMPFQFDAYPTELVDL